MSAPLTLIEAVEAMVAQKRTVGYKYEAEEAVLSRFVACWFSRGTEPVFPPRSEPPLSMVF
jgi:integrase/recombinase XerD